MLVVPIINNGKIMNYEIKLRNQEIVNKDEIGPNSPFARINSGEVYYKGRCYSKWFEDKSFSKASVVDNIKNFSVQTNSENNNIFVSTKTYKNSPSFDIYKVGLPNLDTYYGIKELYGRMIDDIRRSVPDNSKSRIISFKTLGIDRNIDYDKINLIKRINDEFTNASEETMDRIYTNNGVYNTVNLVRVITDVFGFKAVDTAHEDLGEYMAILNAENELNTDLGKKMQKKYDIAVDNTEVFNKIAKVAHITNVNKGKVKKKIKED